MNTRCPPKRVPLAARFFTLCRLTVQPPQSYSVGGQRSFRQLTGKPAGARPNYRGRWYARDNMKLALTPTRCSDYEYPIYFLKQLDDNWLRAIDKLTQEVMLVKRVLVTSNWRKILENFLFLQPRPFILLPYAVVYDRKGFMYYIMQYRDIKGPCAGGVCLSAGVEECGGGGGGLGAGLQSSRLQGLEADLSNQCATGQSHAWESFNK
ncbi:UNVERIFIED_CONTAM: hypothetical protein FKN15_021937 [Acipenser sinensis]